MELEETGSLISDHATKPLLLNIMVLVPKQKCRSVEQDRKPCAYDQLFYKGGKAIQWRKDSRFNKLFWKNCTAARKKMKLELLIPQ